MIYDEGWDLFGYSGWSPQLNGMVVSFRCAATPLLACNTGGAAPVKADRPCCGTQRVQRPGRVQKVLSLQPWPVTPAL